MADGASAIESHKLGLSLPNTATADELFNSCAAHGDGNKDNAAMVTAPERMANHKVA